MITITVRLLSRGLWAVQARNLDGTRIARDGNDVPWRDTSMVTNDLAWEHVGSLINLEPDKAAFVKYVDERPRPSAIDATIRGTREN